MTDTEREALCARIDELCAEVERLREEVNVAGMVAYVQDMKGLKAENTKLRELARDVHTLHWNGLDCTECPWFDECDTTGGCPWLSIFADHMRSLGIEVDG